MVNVCTTLVKKRERYSIQASDRQGQLTGANLLIKVFTECRGKSICYDYFGNETLHPEQQIKQARNSSIGTVNRESLQIKSSQVKHYGIAR